METMTDEATRGAGEIEELLATRQRITDWLQRLDGAGDKVPTSVRDRVRTDYQKRLADVVESLRGHSSAITETLTGLRRELADQERRQSAEEEALAEAQLRYSVGEYTEEEWRAHEEQSGTQLERFGAETHRLGTEIVRLEEVLAQIAGAPRPPESAPAAPLAAEAEEVGAGEAMENYQLETETFITIEDAPADPRTLSVFDSTAELPSGPDPALEPPPVPEAPRFTPRGGAIPTRPRPLASQRAADDELAFLKSVTTTGARATTEARPAAPPPAVATKTLKCQDCGTLNRPTEWYCERCGAELSAV